MSKLSYNLIFSIIIFVFLCLGLRSSAFTNLNTLNFEESLSPLFGDANLVRSPDDFSVRLLLDKYTGIYLFMCVFTHGFFILFYDHSLMMMIRFWFHIIEYVSTWILQLYDQASSRLYCRRRRRLLRKSPAIYFYLFDYHKMIFI